MADSEQYYVRRRGRVDGPWPLEKLRSEVSLNKLGKHDEVSFDGSNWKRASEVEGLIRASSTFKTLGGSGAYGAASNPNQETTDFEQANNPTETRHADPSAESGAEWYYNTGGESHEGPVTILHLAEMVLTGECPLDATVWREGMADWELIESVPQIRACLEAAPGGNNTAATQVIQAEGPQKNSLATTAMVLGIISLLISFIPLMGLLGIPAIITGFIGMRRAYANTDGPRKGLTAAVVGAATGALATLMAIIVFTALAIWLVNQQP